MCVDGKLRSNGKAISWEELALHSSPSDLWVAIEVNAYDVTAWRLDHPGGWRLLEVGGAA